MKPLVAAALVLFISLPAAAQPAGSAAGQRDRREKVKQRIRALRAYTLTEQLDLDEATAAKLFPALAKYDEQFDKLLLTRADVQKRLAAAGAIKDAKALDALIDEAVANQRALWDTEDQRLRQFRKILTPAQTARVLVVLPAMERKIQNQLRQAATQSIPQPVARAPNGAGSAGGAELTSNPFGSSLSDDGEVINPFGRKTFGRKAGGPDSKAPRAARPCDPFTNKHGCTK